MFKRDYRLLIFSAVGVMLSLCSCVTSFTAFNVTVPKELDLTSGDVRDKIPLRAGLYLNSTFKNYTQETRTPFVPSFHRVTYYMGDALSQNCERMLKNIFQRVVIVEETDIAKDVDVLIAPELLGMSYQTKVPEGGTSNAQGVQQLKVRWNIASPDGKTIYTTTVTGEAVYKYRFLGFTVASWEAILKEEMLQLVKAHFSQAQDDIYTNTWWKKQWWKNNN